MRIKKNSSRVIAWLLSSVGIIIIVSLFYYKETYTSWVCASSNIPDMSVIDSFFSIIAATLLHMVGYVTAYAIGIVFFIVSWHSYHARFFDCWERICGCFCAVLLCAPLSALYRNKNHLLPFSGGVVGYQWCKNIGHHFYIVYAVTIFLFLISLILSMQFWPVYRVKGITRKLFCLFPFKNLLFMGKIGRKNVVHILMRFSSKIKTMYSFFHERKRNVLLQKKLQKTFSDNTFSQMYTIDKESSSFSDIMTHSSVEQVQKDENENDVSPAITSPVRCNTFEHIPETIFSEYGDSTHDIRLKKEGEEKAALLEKKLERFGIMGKIVGIHYGPLVTVFEYEPQIDTKLSKIIVLEDDLAMVLQSPSVRILAPIPGTAFVGFEVANKQRQMVGFKQLFLSSSYRKGTHLLPLILGLDTGGKECIADLATMPHLLIAGSTGSGKSVVLNTILMSLLSKNSFSYMRLILIDPKRLEFMQYGSIPHLLFPIVTEAKKAILVLKWVVGEMDRRYEQMACAGVRDCKEFNQKCNIQEYLPFIVVVIDELSDLMIITGKEIEELITRITQMARAAGIHMIIATQRPSVDVITGVIKVNFTSRLALRVASRIDSRTILDCNGAERLLPKGDMLFLDGSNGQLKRLHGAYISTQEVEKGARYLCLQAPPQYTVIEEVMHDSFEQEDSLFSQVVSFVEQEQAISTSLLQRKFRIGYNRAARMIELLEKNGYILPADGAKMRKVVR